MHIARPAAVPARPACALPFVVRPATGPEDLAEAAWMRAEAYGRHLPAFAAGLRTIEAADRSPGTLVLLARSKDDGRPVGTVRLHIDRERPLPIEASVHLPAWLSDAGPLIEPTRLGVEASACGALARTALLKACHLHATALGAAWIVAAARRPLDRMYRGLLFRDVFDGGPPLPMRHIGDLPHRVMALPVRELRAMSESRRHPLHAFFFETTHPDLVVEDIESCTAVASRPAAGIGGREGPGRVERFPEPITGQV